MFSATKTVSGGAKKIADGNKVTKKKLNVKLQVSNKKDEPRLFEAFQDRRGQEKRKNPLLQDGDELMRKLKKTKGVNGVDIKLGNETVEIFGERELKLKIRVSDKKSAILFKAFQDAIKSPEDRRGDSLNATDFLKNIKMLKGFKGLKLKLGNKTVQPLYEIHGDWETCVQTADKKMALQLLGSKKLPNMKTLNKLCATFGRKSDIALKVCKLVCCFIKTNNAAFCKHIINVYASREAVVLQKTAGKEKEFQIKFVVVTEGLDENRRKKLENCIQSHYDTLPIRDRYQLSCEETELAKKGRHILQGEDLNKIKTCMRLNAESLLERHTYLTMISGSLIKSMGYGTSKPSTEETPCIVLNVPYKGYIPIEEEPFQKEYNGVVTDVREDIFVLFKDTANAKHSFLKTGCQISTKRDESGMCGTGTLGGFVFHPEYGLCGITCSHVLLSEAELKKISGNEEISGNKEISWEGSSLLAGKKDTTIENNVFQPIDSETDNNQIGKLVKVLYKSGKADSLDMDAYGMDVALFQLNQRLPKSSEFPTIQVASDDISSDGNDNNSPAYQEVPRQFKKGAVAGFAWLEGKDYSKFGAATGYTTGEVSVNCGISVKDTIDYDTGKFKFKLHNQVSIIKKNTDTDDILPIDRSPDSKGWFGHHGDSGALVYQITPDGNLVCVAMIVGGKFATKQCIVTPILPVLKEMGITSFKDFDSEQDMELVKQRMENVQQSMETKMDSIETNMVNVQQSMGNVQQRMETRMDRIETNMNNGFDSIKAILNRMQNP